MTGRAISGAGLREERTADRSDPLLTTQQQRLEAIGRLVPGLAHEVNTPIQFVGDSIYFVASSAASLFVLVDAYARFVTAAEGAGVAPALLSQVRAAEEDADLAYIRGEIPIACERATIGVARIAEIVRALQALAQIGVRERAQHDLHRIVQEVLIVTRNETKYVADVATELGPPLRVTCDGTAIGQVLIALVVNAAESIREAVSGTDRRGRIEIRLRGDADGVSFAVTDDGRGIADDVRQRIFEPSFTTRTEPGRGRGLAVARSIVERHGGTLDVESGSGGGATFRFSLPLDDTVENVI